MTRRILLGLSGGSALVPFLAFVTGTPVPCGSVDLGCERLATEGADKVFGVPLSLLALLVCGVVAFGTGRRWAAPLALAAASASLVVQLRNFQLSSLSCPWCVASASFLFAFGIVETFAREPRSRPGMPEMIASAAPLMVAPLFVPKPEYPKISLANVSRPFLTETRDRSRRTIVLFGSPFCPACRLELVRVGREEKDARIVYRFVPLRRDQSERAAAMRLRQAIDDDRRADWIAFLADGRNLDLRPGTDAIRLSRRLDVDEGVARKLGITKVPLRLDCPPGEDCLVR